MSIIVRQCAGLGPAIFAVLLLLIYPAAFASSDDLQDSGPAQVENAPRQQSAKSSMKINMQRILAGADAPNSIVRNAVAKVLEEPSDSKLVNLYIAKLQKKTPKTIDTFKIRDTPPPVVRHLRGTSKVQLPTQGEVTQAFASNQIDTRQVMAKPEYQQSMQLYEKVKQESRQIKETPPELPSCPEDVVRALKLESADQVLPVQVDDHIELDWLFVRNKPQGDIEEIFGKDTIVHVYTTNPDDLVSLMVAKQGIECLPYRVRMSTKYAVHMLGLPALKNYDTKKNGVLYEGLKGRIRDYR